MLFTLGSIIVKGARTYILNITTSDLGMMKPDEAYSPINSHGAPLSMHAEMNAIYNLTVGRTPPSRQRVHGMCPLVF